jgi:hypothetical protein
MIENMPPMMLCIFKALIVWLILLVVSGSVGLFFRQALFGLLEPFPPESDDVEVAEALHDIRSNMKRGYIIHTIVCFVVSAAYLGVLVYFGNITLAITAFLMMAVVVEHYAKTPAWVQFISNAVLWGSSVLVWYALCY